MSSLAEASSPYPAVARRHLVRDERVYRELTTYCFDEAVCFPSQVTIARRLRICRQAVNESIQRMVDRGWLTIRKVRGDRWDRNEYELLRGYLVSDLANRRITRRAHRRQPFMPTSPISVGPSPVWCRCRHCRHEKVKVGKAPRPDWTTARQRRWGLLAYHDALVGQIRRRGLRAGGVRGPQVA